MNNYRFYSDRNKLDSILTNLIKNAFKFTHKGGITFGCERDGDELRFYVKDTGTGIKNDKLAVIFDRFIQADMKLSRGYEGSGLGLAICKGYTEKLGGRIWAESEWGKGSTFYFTINNVPVKDKEILGKGGKSMSSSKKYEQIDEYERTLLLVEDDDSSAMFLEVILEGLKCKIIRAVNGIDAIQKFENNPDIALVLMDIKLPEMDGIEATKKIKLINKNVPVIAQTAYAFKEDAEKFKKAGCDDYISKPIKKKAFARYCESVFVITASNSLKLNF